MDEPLMHNKTAFPIILLGFDETNRLKDLQRKIIARTFEKFDLCFVRSKKQIFCHLILEGLNLYFSNDD